MKIWNDKNLEKRYNRIKEQTLKAPNIDCTEDTFKSPTLESWKFKTKSVRIWRMIELAYTLGQLRAIKSIDDGQNTVSHS